MRLRLFSFSLFVFFSSVIRSQEHVCALHKQASAQLQLSASKKQPTSPQITHEMKYDVKFVHLNLELERTNKYIKGSARCIQTVTVAALDTFQCLLHQNFTIDSVQVNGITRPWLRQDSMIKTFGFGTLPANALISSSTGCTLRLRFATHKMTSA